MKTYILSFLLVGMSICLNAQNRAYSTGSTGSTGGGRSFAASPSNYVDPEDKDISVVSEVLRKLIHQEFNQGDTTVNVKEIKGSYLSGNGVLFAIRQYMPFYRSPMALGVSGWGTVYPNRYGLTTTNGQLAEVRGFETPQATTARGRNTQKPAAAGGQHPLGTIGAPNTIELVGDSVGVQVVNGQVLYTSNGSMIFNQNLNSKNRTAKIQDSIFAAKIPRLKKVLERFLAEYTILLNKVKPDEKIWVTWTFKEDYWGMESTGSNVCELSAKILKQDMLDLRAGKLDQAKFAERIQYSITQCATPQAANPEIEVFTAILNRLYSAEVSQNLVSYPGVKGNVIGGFGYNFTMDLMPGAVAFAGVNVDAATGLYTVAPQKQATKEEVESKVKAFKTEFPSQLLEYSRILKGLKTGEILKVDVSVGSGNAGLWSGNEAGRGRWTYTLPQSLIRDYDTGKVKLEDAVKLIQVEEKK